MSAVPHNSVARLKGIALLALIVVAATGCPRKDSPPLAAKDQPYRQVSENRPRVPEPPATTPEEAFSQFMRASSFEDYLDTLTEETKKRWNEWLETGKRCADVDRKFNEELDKRFGKDSGPSVPPRAKYFPPPIGKGEYFPTKQYYELAAPAGSATNSTELVAKWYPALAPGVTPPPQLIFTAVKEGQHWKLKPPLAMDPTTGLEQLNRYIAAKEEAFKALAGGEFRKRDDAVRALTAALRRNVAEKGSPGEAIEVYEASLLALDFDGYTQVLCKESREALVNKIAFERRQVLARKRQGEALDERFGPLPTSTGNPYVFDESVWFDRGLVQLEVLEFQEDAKGALLAKLRQDGSEIAGRDFTLKLRMEAGVWKIEFDESERWKYEISERNRKRVELVERFTREINSGRFASRREFDKAYGEAMTADSPFRAPVRKE